MHIVGFTMCSARLEKLMKLLVYSRQGENQVPLRYLLFEKIQDTVTSVNAMESS